MKNKLNLLRIIYILPVLLFIGLIEVPVGCEMCGGEVMRESILCRIVSKFDNNYLCGMDCALDYLEANPLEYDENGDIIRKW